MFTVYEKGISMMKEKIFVGKTGLIPGVLLRDLEKRIPEIRNNMLASLSNLQAPYLLDREFIPPPAGKKQPKS